jgi:hypothetical protein
LPAPLRVASVVFDVHTLTIASISVLAGAQMVSLGVYAQMFAARVGLLNLKPSRYALIQNFSLEIGIALGVGVALLGIVVDLYALWVWSRAGFGPLNYEETLRIVIPGSTLIGLGVQIFFSSFMISILDLQ